MRWRVTGVLHAHRRAGAVSLARRVAAVLVVASSVVVGVVSPAAAELIPPNSTATSFPAGSLIVDLGQLTGAATQQTIAQGLKPYGFAFELLVNRKIPVTWAIANGKVAGNPPATGKADGDDFSASIAPNGSGGPTTKTYKGSAFIIPAPFLSDLPGSVLATWRGQGVVIDVAQSSFTAPAFTELTSWPKSVLDAQNGALAIPYYQNAGIPASLTPAVPAGAPLFETWSFKDPSELNACEDIFVMPHADPTWVTHSNLLAFNNSGGAIWAGCHAISVLENIDGPDGDVLPDLNFLSTTGLLPFGSHADGSPPYAYSADGSDPILQFLGTADAAMQNGSEQIFMPNAGGAWRPTTKILAWDPTHADVPAKSPGEAAVIVYGRGFGQATNGIVMYQGGHRLSSGSTADAAAQRAFLNEHLLAGYERAAQVDVVAPANANAAQQVDVDATITGGTAPYNYQWNSSCGGTFGTASGSLNAEGPLSTTFTPPAVADPTDCNIRLLVTDSCGRGTFGIDSMQITPPTPPVAEDDSFETAHGIDVSDTVTTNDTYPVGATFAVTSPPPVPRGAVVLGSGGAFVFTPAAGFSGTTTFDYEVCLGAPFATTCDPATVTIAVGPSAVDDAYAVANDTDVVASVADNDVASPSATYAVTSPPSGSDGTLILDPDGSFVFDPAPDFSGTTSFDYQVCLASPHQTLCDTATATITVGPGAVDDSYVSPVAGGTVQDDLGPNDSYPSSATFSLVRAPSNGNLVLDPIGTFTYTPNPGFSGTDTFDYEVCFPVPPGDPSLPTELCSVATAMVQIAPEADLGVTKAHEGALVQGGTVTYIVNVDNGGPSPAFGARVTDAIPAGLAEVSWTCSGGGGGACSSETGIGALDTVVDLPDGGSVRFEVSAVVIGEAGTEIINIARVAAPAGFTDPNPDNDEATDIAPIEPPPVGALAMTGSDTRAWTGIGGSFLGIGLALGATARRRRRRMAG